jgi:hypothetical protein
MSRRVAALRPGDLVDVKTPEEILATLDADGTLDHLPFMPEMVQFCGKRFRVSRPPGRLCVTGPQPYGTMREFTTDDVVLLDDVRCSGAAHDGCQRACLIFWRHAWLRKVSAATPRPAVLADAAARLRGHLRTTSGPDRYFCQASELFKVTTTLGRRAQLGRSLREVATGRVGPVDMARRLAIWLFWRLRGKVLGAYGRGRHAATPTTALNLRPGEWVEVKAMESIRETLNATAQNRGLYFSPDMRLACGGRYRVNGRVERIIEDGTGAMRHLRNTVSLDGSLCACPYINIGGCSRADLIYWREIWLRRIETPAEESEQRRSAGGR